MFSKFFFSKIVPFVK